MDKHTLAFVGVLMCIVALAFLDLLTNLRINGTKKPLEKLAALVYKVRSDAWDDCRRSALVVVEDRKQELDKQERAIHEEMATLTRVLFDAAEMLKEFVSQVKEEASHDDPAGAGGHTPGGGGAGGGAPNQADLPPSYGEIGGAG